MPIVRFEVRNEFGLGKEELYKEASRLEDPKPLLDGLAVSGFVGILRQLGDLAEFAAEVFHGLQEQVMTTASRSHRLVVRVQNIEAALPPLEKAVLAQTSHIHFAYTAGSEWHPRILKEQNHFIYNDLPRFIMDSYEECRDPPRLHLLDKFDAGGPGSCLKRYSDPTYFRKISGNFRESDADKARKDKKSRKSKKKRSSQRHGHFRSASMPACGGRMLFDPSFVNGRTSTPYTTSTVDWTLKSDAGDQSNSFDSRAGSGYIEHVFHLKPTVQLEEHRSSQVSLGFTDHDDISQSVDTEGHRGSIYDNFPQNSSPWQIAPTSSCATWDERAEIIDSSFQHCKGYDDIDSVPRTDLDHRTDMDLDEDGNIDINPRNSNQIDFAFDDEDSPKSSVSGVQLDEVESEPDNYLDARNTIESESENDIDCLRKHEVEQFASIKAPKEQIQDGESHILDHCLSEHETLISSHASSCMEDQRKREGEQFTSISSSKAPKEQIHDGESHIFDHGLSEHEALISPHASSSIQDQRKLEGEQFTSISSSKALKEQIHDGESHILDHGLSEHEALISPHASSSIEAPNELDSSVPFKRFECEEASHVSGTSSDSDNSAVSGGSTTNVVEGVILDSVVSHPSSLDPITAELSEATSDNDLSISCNYQESTAEISGGTPLSKSKESEVELSGSISVTKPQETDVEHSGGTSASNPQECKAELSGVVTPVTIWTNGGLLGLQPSKPPDFARPNVETLDFVTTSKGDVGPPNPTPTPSYDGGQMRPGRLVDDAGSIDRGPSSKCSTSWHVDYDSKINNSNQSHDSLRCGNDGALDKATGRVATQKEMAPDLDVPMSTHARRLKDESSSRMFGLGHRLLVDGLRRTLSLSSDGKSELANLSRTSSLDQSSRQDGSTIQATKAYNEEFKWNLTMDSPSSSPPLGHMKISFHPANGFDASKLRLKLPNGSHGNESIADTFPSFQLVPEVMSVLGVGSLSDNDTFCRSSPYRSDDCCSHQSELDSELWESGDSPEHKDHEVYDSLRRNSSFGNVSSSFQTGDTAGTIGLYVEIGPSSVYNENRTSPSLSASLLDLPSFDSMNAVMRGEMNNDLKAVSPSELQHFRDSSPLPPPLPPVQWQASKTASDRSEDAQHSISEALKHAFGQNPPEPSPYQQANSRQVLATKQLTNEKSNSFRWSKGGIEFKQKEANQPAIGEGSEEDFLHGVSSQSFSLRRTMTGKPTPGSGPATNDKVTAILEKANAIRQAVGSDAEADDDDNNDTWSNS